MRKQAPLVLVLVLVALAACGDRGDALTGGATSPSPFVRPTPPAPSSTAPMTAIATAPPSPTSSREPVSLGRSAEAGTVVLVSGGNIQTHAGDALWLYDGPSGRLERGDRGRPDVLKPHAYVFTLTAEGARGYVDLRAGYARLLAPDSALAVDAAPAHGRRAYVTRERSLFVALDEHAMPKAMAADLEVVGVRWSPDGQLLALDRAPLPGTVSRGGREDSWPLMPSELWLLDPLSGAKRRLYAAPDPFSRATGFRFGTWSPDGRYVTLWEVVTFSGSVDLDGRPLLVIDTLTGERVELGRTLLARSWLAWAPPHTLAFVSGMGRATCDGKALKLWSPENGVRQLTTNAEVAVSPSWGRDGWSLYFIRSPQVPYQPRDYVAGRGSGERQVVLMDVRTGARHELPRAPGFAAEAVRVSADGSALLVLRRRLEPWHAKEWAPMELWLLRVDGSEARPLVRLTQPGYCYASAWLLMEQIAWSR